MTQVKLSAPDMPWAPQGDLLSPPVRRDIADLNRLFLGRALDPAQRTDQWFQLPGGVVERLAAAPEEARERAAQCPVSLFELVLPPADAGLHWRREAVADGDVDALDCSRDEARRSFGLVALGVARRLAEGVPLCSRIAFGLLPAGEARLSALSPCEAFRLASWPGLVRPRWAGHARFWELLADAATGPSSEILRWTYSTGLCLLGECERQQADLRLLPRRRLRPAQRRPPTGRSGVPC